jgi:hypothetical protein
MKTKVKFILAEEPQRQAEPGNPARLPIQRYCRRGFGV